MYTVLLLSTRPDCQALINIANKEKEDLLYIKSTMDRKLSSSSEKSEGIESTLITISTELQATQSYYDSLPEGKLKDDILARMKKYEFTKFTLEQRKENYGVLVVLKREYEIAVNAKAIIETENYIDALTDRMNQLP